jgi:hypothetical protein
MDPKPIDTQVEFEAWPKIPRAVLGDCVMSLKMDGTNACVIIKEGAIVGVQSRKRLINVGKENDNYGFATYVSLNEDKFLALGEGRHYGEWAGLGIQKNPHNLPNKQFFLFNTRRWGEHNPPPEGISVVEVLHHGEYTRARVDEVMNELKTRSDTEGWKAEGIVVYFPKLDAMEKHTFEYSKGKWTGVK